jgi:hypothetical protein
MFWNLLDYEPLAYAYIYALFVGSFHALLVSAAAIVLIPRLVLSGWARYFQTLRRFFLLNALLLAFGILGNSIWMALVYTRLYISQDTLVDFFPFIPFGQWALDVEFGGKRGSLLNGAGLWQLRSLWALLASLVWILTILVYRRITKRHFLISSLGVQAR